MPWPLQYTLNTVDNSSKCAPAATGCSTTLIAHSRTQSRRIPRHPRGNAYARVGNPNPAFVGEGMRYRNLPIDRSTTTLDRSSQNTLERTKSFGTLGSLGRGWKAQGMLTGKGRDHLGQQRWTLPSEAPAGKAAREGSPNQSDACSVPSMEVPTRFERLVEELRERLPRYPPPLLDAVVAQSTSSLKSIDDGNSPKQGQVTDSVSDVTATGRKPGAVALETGPMAGLTNHTNGQGRREEARNSDSAPSSYTGLRDKGVRNFLPKYGQNEISQLLLRSRDGADSCRQRGHRPSTMSLPKHQKKNAVAPYRNCGGSSSAMIIAPESPSAAMVAAAKAQERALPLLQVCAVTIADPYEPRWG